MKDVLYRYEELTAQIPAIPSISCKFPSPGPHEFGSTHCEEAGPL